MIEDSLDRDNPREWYWALMDYGAMLAKTVPNPNRRSRHHVVQSKFEGSNRQVRGAILKSLLQGPQTLFGLNTRLVGPDQAKIRTILEKLISDGFIRESNGSFSIR